MEVESCREVLKSAKSWVRSVVPAKMMCSEVQRQRFLKGLSRAADHPANQSQRGTGARLTGRSQTGLMARRITSLQLAG
jgi:hypothetical protein